MFALDHRLRRDAAPVRGHRRRADLRLLSEAICEAAHDHRGQCVDVRPIINEPTLDQPGDENSPEVMQAITDALANLGLPELGMS